MAPYHATVTRSTRSSRCWHSEALAHWLSSLARYDGNSSRFPVEARPRQQLGRSPREADPSYMSTSTATRPAPRILGLDKADLIAVVVILTVAMLIRWAFHFRAPVFLEGDSQSYLLPAWDLLHGEAFAPELRRAPIYPLFITGSFSLAGIQLEVLAAVQHLLGVVTVLLTYILARRWLG